MKVIEINLSQKVGDLIWILKSLGPGKKVNLQKNILMRNLVDLHNHQTLRKGNCKSEDGNGPIQLLKV